MRIRLPHHDTISVDPNGEWTADPIDPAAPDFGLYLRSNEFAFYLNLREQPKGAHSLDATGMSALLREQGWPSAPFDEWVSTAGARVTVGATFEMQATAEVVVEVFVTDGRSIVNFAGPAERTTLAAAMPSIRRLVETLRFD
jgi:hypothetical protein